MCADGLWLAIAEKRRDDADSEGRLKRRKVYLEVAVSIEVSGGTNWRLHGDWG